MSHDATQNRLSPYVPEVALGIFARLGFPAQLENDFRKQYSRSGVVRARVMPCFAIMMTILAAVLRMSGGEPWLGVMIWDLGVFMPVLVATLYYSARPDDYAIYQRLLALAGLLSGFVVTSLYFRPTLVGMPSYFSMEVTWLLGIWLILGLRFGPAAIVASLISVCHVIGLVYLGAEAKTLGYESVMLLLVNAIGATGCYQLECTTRRSFLESLELEDLTKELTKLAERDGLTGLNNRRTYDAYIDRLWRQRQREDAVLAILLVDIDYFKPYNDRYGHQNGDNALVSVADVIAEHAQRPLDFAARYGGEEFVLALHYSQAEVDYQTAVDNAREHAEKLRVAISGLRVPHDRSAVAPHLTASVGMAIVLPGSNRSLDGALQMADEALYQAKEEGRNRVIVMQTGDVHFHTGRFRAKKYSAA